MYKFLVVIPHPFWHRKKADNARAIIIDQTGFIGWCPQDKVTDVVVIFDTENNAKIAHNNLKGVLTISKDMRPLSKEEEETVKYWSEHQKDLKELLNTKKI